MIAKVSKSSAPVAPRLYLIGETYQDGKEGGGGALTTNQRGLHPQTVQVRVTKARASDPLGQRITVHRGEWQMMVTKMSKSAAPLAPRLHLFGETYRPKKAGGGGALRTNQRGLPPQTVQVRVTKAHGSDPLGQRIMVYRGGKGDDERYNFKQLSAFGSSLVFNWGNVSIRKGGGRPQDKSARPASPDRPGPSCKGPWIRSTRTTHHCPSGEMGDDGHQHFKKLSAGGAALVFSWGDVPRLKGGGCALRTNQRGLPPQTVQVRVAKARGSDPLGQRITVHQGNGR